MADTSTTTSSNAELSTVPSVGPMDLSVNSSHSTPHQQQQQQQQAVPAPASPQRMPPSPQRSTASVPSLPGSPRRQRSTQQTTPQATPQLTPQEASPIVLSSSSSQQVVDATAHPELPRVPMIEDGDDSGIALGLEQLERQQEEAERRRKQQVVRSNNINRRSNNSIGSTDPQVLANPPAMLSLRPAPVPQDVVEQYLEDGEASTAMSSTITGNTGDGGRGGSSAVEDEDSLLDVSPSKKSIGRMIKSAKRHLSSSELIRRREDGEDPVEEEDDIVDDSVISGHLQKLGRNGKWQTRWFESDGECLSYYKKRNRSKLLATLDLAKVGSIVVNDEDTKGCTFTIQVLGRPYHLRANSKASCKDWVITLNRVKEARLEQGNIKLIAPTSQQPLDLLDENVSEYNVRVVAIANRKRTTAVTDVTMETLEFPKGENPEGDPNNIDADGSISTISQAVLAQWQKRRSRFSRLAQKLARWARSLKKYNCADFDRQVSLDQHVHPPGHDDKHFSSIAPEGGHQKDPGLKAWIGKETSHAGIHKVVDEVNPIESKASDSVNHLQSEGVSDDEELETRYLS